MSFSLPGLFFAPVLFALVVVSACAVYYALRRGSSDRVGSDARIYRCSICGHVYVDSREVPLARCPRCGCLNEAVRR
jgi:hypothetical protein